MSAIWARIEAEPVLVTTLVGALLEAAIAFGVRIDDAQKAAIMALVAAGLALVARQQVTPVVSPTLNTGTTVTIVSGSGVRSQSVV